MKVLQNTFFQEFTNIFYETLARELVYYAEEIVLKMEEQSVMNIKIIIK